MAEHLYEQWAKVFNIKQIAQTMNFLRENSGMDYDELVRQTDAATARFNTLSAQIKAAETRMAEIAVLKTQVINYAKTRKIFDGYKASRYSKKTWQNTRQRYFFTVLPRKLLMICS